VKLSHRENRAFTLVELLPALAPTSRAYPRHHQGPAKALRRSFGKPPANRHLQPALRRRQRMLVAFAYSAVHGEASNVLFGDGHVQTAN
jgi:prepilin-type processing-associated H-X9-DG protein